MNKKLKFVLIVLVISCFSALAAQAQTSAFTYQGRFTDSTVPQPTNGSYNMQFALYDASNIQQPQPTPITVTNNGVTVTNGLFTVALDFGANVFTSGADRFLETRVFNTATSGYVTLTPRQQLTSSPFSVRTISAGVADSLSNLCVLCVSDANISAESGSKVTGTVTHATTADTAGNVTSVIGVANGGTGGATQNFVDLTTDQTIVGIKTFTGISTGDGSGLRNVSGANIAGSTALNPQRLAILRWYDINSATATLPISVGNNPDALTFDGTFIYVANFAGNSVSRIRASTGLVEGIPIATGPSPTALVFDGTFIYVANDGDNSVTRIRASTGVVEGSSINVGATPVALASDGTFIYIANQGANSVTRIRTSTGVVEGSPIAVGSEPSALVFDGTFVYVSNFFDKNVMRIRASTGLIEGSPFAVGGFPAALVFDGTFVYAANVLSTNVVRIRAATGVVEGSPVTVGKMPRALVFDGTFVYVANEGSNNVTRIRASTGVVEGTTTAVGNFPVALAFDGTYVYAANQNSDSVTRF